MGEIAPFTIEVPDAVLDDLRRRLAATRFTPPSSAEPWAAGVDPTALSRLVADWIDLDWRGVEAELNALDHRMVTAGGVRTHVVLMRVAPRASRRIPLLAMHGWPSTFLEMLPLAGALEAPAAAAGIGFDLVIPSMPGFLFSELPPGPITREAMADVLHAVMTEALGHAEYTVFGGDIGGTVAAWLAAKHPEQVSALAMIHPPFPAEFAPAPTREEQAFLDAEEVFDATDGGYSAIMITRPDTVAAALVDSPAGLAAWIIDKLRDWSDCGGDLETRFDRRTQLVMATLYWITGSIGTSFRQYFDFDANRPRPVITVPSAFIVSAEPAVTRMPRSIAERSCTDIRVWRRAPRGGHFLAHEEPELLARELVAFLGGLAQ